MLRARVAAKREREEQHRRQAQVSSADRLSAVAREAMPRAKPSYSVAQQAINASVDVGNGNAAAAALLASHGSAVYATVVVCLAP